MQINWCLKGIAEESKSFDDGAAAAVLTSTGILSRWNPKHLGACTGITAVLHTWGSDDPPPARAHDRARWWHLARRLMLGVVPAPLLAAGARLLQAVPWADASEAARRPQGRPVAVLRPAYSPRRAQGFRGLSGAAA